jgi:hypothetical protein
MERARADSVYISLSEPGAADYVESWNDAKDPQHRLSMNRTGARGTSCLVGGVYAVQISNIDNLLDTPSRKLTNQNVLQHKKTSLRVCKV